MVDDKDDYLTKEANRFYRLFIAVTRARQKIRNYVSNNTVNYYQA